MALFRKRSQTDAFGLPVTGGGGLETLEEQQTGLAGLFTRHPWHAAFSLYVLTSVVLTVVWGVWGWAASMLALALALLYAALRTYLALRTRHERHGASQDESVLTALPLSVNPLEAELLCQALEREGIPATYFGRADPRGSIPGGGVGLGWTRRYRVGVRAGDIERALTLARGLDATKLSQ